MMAIPYAEVLRGAAQLISFDADALPLGEGRRLRDCLSRRLEMGWQAEFWPALMQLEARLFAPQYAALATYGLLDHVWFAGTQQYYQALRATVAGQAPATLSGSTWTTNAAYWAAAATNVFAPTDWSSSTVYAQGAVVRSTVDGEVYQLFAASSTNEEPSANAGKWGQRGILERTVDYDQVLAGGEAATPIGEVANVWDRHPDEDARSRRLPFVLRAGGVTVRAAAFAGILGTTVVSPDQVWVEFRTRAPVLFGEPFDAAATYAAGDQVFYGSDAAGSGSFRGDFFDCVTATSAGESPATAAAKWGKVEIPRFLRRYLERGAAADYLRGEGDGPVLEGDAQAEMDRQVSLFRGEQGQEREMEVLTR